MDETLRLIGGFFLVISVAVLLGGLFEVVRKRQKVTDEGIFKALGIVTLFMWILIGFGVVSWLIGVVFTGGLSSVWWLSERTHIPFLLVLASPMILGFIWSIVLSLYRKLRGSKLNADEQKQT